MFLLQVQLRHNTVQREAEGSGWGVQGSQGEPCKTVIYGSGRVHETITLLYLQLYKLYTFTYFYSWLIS